MRMAWPSHAVGGFALVLLLAACGGSSGGGRYADANDYDEADYDEPVIDADPGGVEAREVQAPDFADCTEDCSGHDAGFEWAQDNDVTDPSECGGDSHSFVAGCEAFAEQRAELAEEAAMEQAQLDEDAQAEYEREEW